MRVTDLLSSVSRADVEPDHGVLTWRAEGQSTGRYASKGIHWPGGESSGVTIGRGYDMGSRTAEEVQSDLIRAGVRRNHAVSLSAGAGLRGVSAERFVKRNSDRLPELSTEQELQLFSSVTYPRYERVVLRIAAKSDVVKAYGQIDFETNSSETTEVLVDLAIRGDYTPETRTFLQKAFVSGNIGEICASLRVLNEFHSVPRERAAARNELLKCAGD